MTALAWLFFATTLVAIALAYWALLRAQSNHDAYWTEANAHDTTRTEFRAVVLEADRSAEALADLENRIWWMQLWPALDMGHDPIYRATKAEVYPS